MMIEATYPILSGQLVIVGKENVKNPYFFLFHLIIWDWGGGTWILFAI